MTEPSVLIYLIQHVGDWRRREPRNVGLIVTDGSVAELRLVDPGARRGRHHQVLATTDYTYPQWHAYWTKTFTCPAETALAGALERQVLTYPIVEVGEFFGCEHDDIKVIADNYFEDLVLPPIEDAPAQKRPLDRVLSEAGLLHSSHLRRGFQVPGVGATSGVPITFPLAWQNGRTAVMQPLLRGAGDDAVQGSLWKFDHIADNIGRVALVDRYIYNRATALVSLLQKTAKVVNVEDPLAAESLLDAVHA